MKQEPRPDDATIDEIRRAAFYEPEAFAANTERSLANLRPRLDRSTSRRFRPAVWTPLLALAAVAAIVAGNLIRASEQKGPGDAARATFQTARGERLAFTLSDGSSMILAPQSSAHFIDAPGERKLSLHGEAFFSVKHDAMRPFIVTARNATATDVGTEFVVRSYDGEPAVDIAVAEGVVKVSTPNGQSAGTILRQGEVARVDASGSASVRRDVDASAFTSWTTGRLAFHDADLVSIAAELSRWFNADVTVPDQRLAQKRLSAVYDKPSLSDILSALSATTGARIERSGNSVRLVTP